VLNCNAQVAHGDKFYKLDYILTAHSRAELPMEVQEKGRNTFINFH